MSTQDPAAPCPTGRPGSSIPGGPGAPQGPVRPGGTLVIAPSTETGCVPACPSATSAVLNVTVTQPKAGGFLTVYPDGQSRGQFQPEFLGR